MNKYLDFFRMNNCKHKVILILFYTIYSYHMTGQVFEQFTVDPFQMNNPVTGLQLPMNNCDPPSYVITNNMNIPCNMILPFPGIDGNFMFVDNRGRNNPNIVYNQTIPPGCPAGAYTFSMDVVHRVQPTTAGNPVPIPLNIILNGTIVGTITINANNGWTTQQINIQSTLAPQTLTIMQNANTSNVNTNLWMDYGLDNITLCFDNPVVNYILVDENTDESYRYCAGDSVFLQNNGTIGDKEYFIQICQQNIGDSVNAPCINWNSIPGPGQWQIGPLPNILNLLTTVWQNNKPSWAFWGGYQYRVGLAIRNNPCYSWISLDRTFIVDEECGFVEEPYLELEINPNKTCEVCVEVKNLDITACAEDINFRVFMGDNTPSYINQESFCHTYTERGPHEVKLWALALENPSGPTCDLVSISEEIVIEDDYDSHIELVECPQPSPLRNVLNAVSFCCYELFRNYPNPLNWDCNTWEVTIHGTNGDMTLYFHNTSLIHILSNINVQIGNIISLDICVDFCDILDDCSVDFCQEGLEWCVEYPINANYNNDLIEQRVSSKNKIISVNPNPASSIIYLDGQIDDASDLNLRVFDMSGKEYINMEYKNNDNIDVSWLPNGLYYISLSSNEYIYNTLSFIKMKD